MDKDGYWGPATATIDWCEANYEVTHYIAEFWNTTSSIIMFVLPIYGVYWSLKMNSKYQNVNRRNKNLNLKQVSDKNLVILTSIPISLIICHIALFLVALGTWLFHMTLQYSMQLLDEIPMLWACSTLIYANADLLINVAYKKPAERTLIRRIVFVLDMFYIVLVTYIYVYHLKNPVFHEVCFAIQIGVIVAENVTLIRKLNLSTRLYFLCLGSFAFGFVLWNIDNNFCSFLKLYRSQFDKFIDMNSENKNILSRLASVAINAILILLKSVSEFHAVWHLFTGYGSYVGIIAVYDAFFENKIKKLQSTGSNSMYLKLKPVKKVIKSKFFGLINNLNDEYLKNEEIKFK